MARQLPGTFRTEDRELAALFNLLEQLPPPKAKEVSTTIKCSGCKKDIDILSVKTLHTGVIHAYDELCGNCYSDLNELTAIICIRCKKVVGRMKPHKTKNGFVFTKGKCVHTEACGCCEPGLTKSKIIEMQIHEKRLNQ